MNLMKSACHPKRILEKKLVLFVLAATTGVAEGEVKMSPRLPGVGVGVGVGLGLAVGVTVGVAVGLGKALGTSVGVGEISGFGVGVGRSVEEIEESTA